MKKILILLCVLLCVMGSACSKEQQTSMSENNNQDTVKNDKDTVIELTQEEQIINDIQKIEKINMEAYKLDCPELLNVVDMAYYERSSQEFYIMFITADGGLYELSVSGLYSNGTCYKKIESSCKFLKFCSVGSHHILGDDGLLYDYKTDNLNAHEYLNYSEDEGITEEREMQKKHSYLTRHSDLWIFKGDSGKVLYNHIITGGKSYVYEEQRTLDLPVGEYVDWFSDNTIKSNKKWYYFKEICVNEEEAEKYIDIEKEYELQLFPVDISENIIFFKIDTYLGPIAIDSNGTFYCKANF